MLRILPGAKSFRVGETARFCVNLENVINLYGADIQVRFPTSLVSVVDADSNAANGINMEPGAFPPANNGGTRTIAANQVIAPNDRMRYAVALLRPSQGVTGSGEVFCFTLQGLATGTGMLTFGPVEMYDQNISPISPAQVEASILVLPAQTPLGTVKGRIQLQSRVDHSGATVKLGNDTTTTDPDGLYAVVGEAGAQELTATMPGYLPALEPRLAVRENQIVTVPVARLIGGDVNDDMKIDLFDLVMVAVNFDKPAREAPRSDINQDGVIDLIDIVMIGANFGKTGVQMSFASSANKDAEAMHKAAGPLGRILADAPKLVRQDQEFKVQVQVRGATGLFGAQFNVGFDPSIVELVDMDEAQAGVQGAIGDALPNAYIAANRLDEAVEGRYDFAATRLAPDSGTSGSGTLATLTFRARAEGNPRIQVTSARLADADAAQLPVILPARSK